MYKLYDVYDGLTVLGLFNSLERVAKACQKREFDTDGECDFVLKIFKNGKYVRVENWVYNEFTVVIKD